MPAPVPTPLPEFAVALRPPDLSPWRSGDAGVPGFITRRAASPGPHLALLGLMHGNEFAGAIVLDRLLRAGFMPRRGVLTMGFVNLAAFERFDPRRPTASRFIDEDLNRVWDEAVLDGPRTSRELARAREILPLIQTVDVLVDLHSMLWPADPAILSGPSGKGLALARGIGTPSLVIADSGHANGKRLIDHRRFVDPETKAAAVLVEAGQHWEADTVAAAEAAVAGVLRHLDMLPANAPLPAPPRVPQRVAEVTAAITAATTQFAFVQAWRGGDVVKRRNTLIALDGASEVRTPHDDCLLVMPSLRPSRGHTA
ncbi:MAG: succinylglutamate desuccinylase/aspartoacylase family protein, partial [Rhodospirillales bacterium]|nr:succinylglutamate desuccinylase/aspartoacylase family protein [Rhodospirillales bacterium]